jgi:hypothetical protein
MADTGFARWEIWTQDTDPSTFTFTNDDGSRLDLTGMVFRLSIEWSGGALLLVSGTDAEIVVEDQSDPDTKGQLTVTLSPAQRALLPTDGSSIKFNIQRVDGGLKLSRPYGEIVAVRWVENA